MGNKQRGIVDIELDKPRKLRYTLNSLVELEEKFGVPMSELKDVKLGIKQVRTFLWAGLIHEDEALTENEVGNMVDIDNIDYIKAKITEAFTGITKNSKGPNGAKSNA